MKHFLLLIFILNLLKSDAGNFDSLLIAAQKLHHDSARVNLFYHGGMDERYTDPAFSYRCARQIEKIYELTRVAKHQALASNLLGILYYRKGDLGTALYYHRRALARWNEMSFKKGVAVSETNLANILTDMKNFGLAENYYLSALEINHELGVELEVNNCLLNLGAMNYEAKNFEAAKNYFQKALEGAKKSNDMELIATCYNNLADVNTVLGAHEDVIANCENSLKIKDLMENEMEKADTYLTLAGVYLKMKNEKEFELNMARADSVIDKFSYAAAKIISFKLKSDFYREKNDFDKAYYYLTRHVNLSDSVRQVNENNFEESPAFAEMSEAYASEEKTTSFPYLYMNILVLCVFGSGWFVFTNRK